MKIETYKQIIFTDNIRKLKNELNSREYLYIVRDDDKRDIYNSDDVYSGFCFRSLFGFLTNYTSNYFTNEDNYTPITRLISKINSYNNPTYEHAYLCLHDIDKMLSRKTYICYKLQLFNLLNSITNKQMCFIINIKYKDYVFKQIEEYNKYIDKLKLFGEIQDQIIFIDDIEKVKDNIDKETDLLKELDGSECKTKKLFYNNLITKLKFPKNIEYKINDFDININKFKSGKYNRVFYYIRNIKDIMSSDSNNLKEKSIICNLLYRVYNERVIILIDKKDKEYFLKQIECGNEMKNTNIEDKYYYTKNKYTETLKNYIIDSYFSNILSIHIDSIIEHLGIRIEQSNKIYLTECIKIYKALIELSQENNWIKDYIPMLYIYLKDTKISYKLKSKLDIDEIARQMSDDAPPEIMLYEKIYSAGCMGNKCIDIYTKNIKKELSEILGFDFTDDYEVNYLAIRYADCYNERSLVCQRRIIIKYLPDIKQKIVRKVGVPELED